MLVWLQQHNNEGRPSTTAAGQHMDITRRRPKFDFDTWAELARKDPQAIELERKLLIERAIMKAPAEKQQRLRCLQWKLDQIRDLASTPMAACLQINRLLWEHICSERGLLHCLERLQSLENNPEAPQSTAKILQFHEGASANLPPSDE